MSGPLELALQATSPGWHRRDFVKACGMAAAAVGLPAKAAAKSADAPLRNYDQLTAKDVVNRVQRLSGPQATAVLEYERARKKRATVIRAAQQRLSAAG